MLLLLHPIWEANSTDINITAFLAPDFSIESDVFLAEVTVYLVGWKELIVEDFEIGVYWTYVMRGLD